MHFSQTQEGGISIGIKAPAKERKQQIAGEDYSHSDYCQVCVDRAGGDLQPLVK